MANIEKHCNMMEIDKADPNLLPITESGLHLEGGGLDRCRNHALPPHKEDHARIILRLDELPATPRNLERIRERIGVLNQRLAASGTPFRLRVV